MPGQRRETSVSARSLTNLQVEIIAGRHQFVAYARLDSIESKLTLRGDLSPQQVARLAEIASRWPVHRILAGEIKIRTAVVEG